jgi:hypothetical protein
MAYYYVKSGGTAAAGADAGRYTSAQTGSFATLGAANYYGKIVDAIGAATPPVAGDEIRVSSSHSLTTGSTITYTYSTTAVISVVSVDDAACDAYLAGAKEDTTQTVYVRGKSSHYGMTYENSYQHSCLSPNSSARYENCTIRLSGSNVPLQAGADGVVSELINTTIYCSATTGGINLGYGHLINWVGGALTAATTAAYLVRVSATEGGGVLNVTGVDLSVVTTALLNHGATQTTDDTLIVRIHGCKLASGVAYFSGSLTNPGTSILVTNSSDTSAAAEYQYYYQDYFGYVDDDTVIYRDESTAFPSGQKISLKCVTTSAASSYAPFAFDVPARYCALSSASTDTIRIYFAVTNTITLTNKNIWAEVIYPDGTNKNVYNRVTSRITDIIGTGTAWTDDSGSSTWKQSSGAADLSGYNEYRMDITTSGDVGADCVPVVRIYIGEPSATVYIDPTLGLVS